MPPKDWRASLNSFQEGHCRVPASCSSSHEASGFASPFQLEKSCLPLPWLSTSSVSGQQLPTAAYIREKKYESAIPRLAQNSRDASTMQLYGWQNPGAGSMCSSPLWSNDVTNQYCIPFHAPKKWAGDATSRPEYVRRRYTASTRVG